MRALLAQLAEGGRLAAIVAREGNIGRATLLRNRATVTSRRTPFDAAVPTFLEFRAGAAFVF